MVTRGRVELPTCSLGVSCSIQLSYRVNWSGCGELNSVSLRPERSVIPIHYTPYGAILPYFASQSFE